MSARRPWAWPLVPLYAVALAVKAALRRLGILRTRKLGWPVVSMGSLSAGGAGKTPVVIALAEMLKQRGWYVDVLSRGYGREVGEQSHDRPAALDEHRAPEVERVDLGVEDAARRFGDEPVLIAQRAGVQVWVGTERFRAGEMAERAASAALEADSSATLRNDKKEMLRKNRQTAVHLLDDGFQHRQLARAMDIVLVTAADLEDALLPAGNLRESPSALCRADAVVLREEEFKHIEPQVLGLLRERTLVWRVRRKLRFPAPLGVLSAGKRPVAFCGIARPESFWAMLAEAGCGVVETIAFGDHHKYQATDVQRLLGAARSCAATGFVTTEKDWVKLSGAMGDRLNEVGPVCVAALEVKLVDEAEVATALEARLG